MSKTITTLNQLWNNSCGHPRQAGYRVSKLYVGSSKTDLHVLANKHYIKVRICKRIIILIVLKGQFSTPPQ